MAMDKCMACGCMRDDSSGTCPGCIALGMREAAAQRSPSAPSGPPRSAARKLPAHRPSGYRPGNRDEYITLMKAVCLAWEAAEFGADLNRQAKAAGADPGTGGRVEVAALRDFACGDIRNNVDDMLECDETRGFGPSEGGSDWEDAYRRHGGRPQPRAAGGMDGERLIWLAESLDRLSKSCNIQLNHAIRLARRAAKEWPRLIPWAFYMCGSGGHRRADCKCARCECCGELGEARCRKCFCDCGAKRMRRLWIDGQLHRANNRGPSESGGVLLCPACDCFECAGRGRMAGADGDRCAECDADSVSDLECPTCREPGALCRSGDGALTCGACWTETTATA